MPYFLISAGCAIVALIAYGEGYRRGRLAHPDTARAVAHIAKLTADRARIATEADGRETRAYERGRLDQAEIEAAQRSERATRGAKTRQERRVSRVNRVTGEQRVMADPAPASLFIDDGEGAES